MLIVISDRIFHQPPHIVKAWENVVEAGPRRGQRVAAAQRRVKQPLRPHSAAHRFPELVPAIGLKPRDAGLPALAAFQHTLQCFEAMEIVAVHAAVADVTASLQLALSGISTDGMRHVTGRLEPAMNGKPIDRDVSYISLAQSQFQERCLSLNTGTERPLSRNTFTVSSKNRYRGYCTCPFGVFG